MPRPEYDPEATERRAEAARDAAREATVIGDYIDGQALVIAISLLVAEVAEATGTMRADVLTEIADMVKNNILIEHLPDPETDPDLN